MRRFGLPQKRSRSAKSMRNTPPAGFTETHHRCGQSDVQQRCIQQQPQKGEENRKNQLNLGHNQALRAGQFSVQIHTGFDERLPEMAEVFPAHAGMNHHADQRKNRGRGVPRARRDESAGTVGK